MRHSAWIALVLSGCAVAPGYKRPDVDVPQRFRAQLETPAAHSLGEAAWWDVYRDPTLQALLKTALAENRDLKLAAARVAEARALSGVARLARWPQVDLTANAGKERNLTLGNYVTAKQLGAGVQVSYEADFWRRLASLDEAARDDLLATEWARENVRASLVANVATAYFDLLAFDQQRRITERTVATRQRFLELTQAKFGHGAASGLDVSRAQASLEQAQAALPDLRRQVEQTENALQILLGQNPGPVVREALDLERMPTPPEVPAGLPSALLQRRPDLQQAEFALAGATARVQAIRAQLFPTISLTGTFGTESTALANLFKGSAKTWSFGIALLQPLLDANRTGYQVDAARAREDQALIQYEQAVAQAFREVSDALIARRDYAELRAAQARQVDALRDASRRVLKRYEGGYSSYFEVVDADRDLYAAELALTQADRNALVALVQLYQALGGGWETAPVADAR